MEMCGSYIVEILEVSNSKVLVGEQIGVSTGQPTVYILS